MYNLPVFFKGIRICKTEFNKKSEAGNRQKNRSIKPTRREGEKKVGRGRKE
jgi:hypothetical protein